MNINGLPATKITINCLSKTEAKGILKSIQRNLPYNWKVSSDEYIDEDTFHFIDQVSCFETYLKSDGIQELIVVKMFVGIIDSQITTLKFNSKPYVKGDDFIFLMGKTIELFVDDLLSKNKKFEKIKDNLIYHSAYDENYLSPDIRSLRMTTVHDLKTNSFYVLDPGMRISIPQKTILINPPNNISLSISIMKKSLKSAIGKYDQLIKNKSAKVIELKKSEQALLFDYFEDIITSITFGYTAVEALSNVAIPDKFEFERLNDKKVREVWNKENIERYMLTSEKLCEVLPKIFKTEDIKQKDFWVRFKELETLRNDVIHQKTIKEGTKMNNAIFESLLMPSIFDKVKSSLEVIKFFYKFDDAHPFFPLGIGQATMQIVQVDSFSSSFKKMDSI